MSTDISKKIRQLVKSAPAASAGTNVNYGRLTITPMVITFHGRGVTPEKRTLAEYAAAQGVDVEEVQLTGNDSFQLHFAIDVQELNPNLQFQYVERDIAVLQNSANGKVKTDWQEIVEPALVKVFGRDWSDEFMDNDEGIYVAAEMVDSLRPVKEGGKNYGVPKVIAKYDTVEECAEARDERYGKRDNDAPVAEVDGDDEIEDEEEVEEEEVEYSPALLKQVFTLYKGNRESEKNTLAVIGKNKAWKDYDAKDLLAAAIKANKGKK